MMSPITHETEGAALTEALRTLDAWHAGDAKVSHEVLAEALLTWMACSNQGRFVLGRVLDLAILLQERGQLAPQAVGGMGVSEALLRLMREAYDLPVTDPRKWLVDATFRMRRPQL